MTLTMYAGNITYQRHLSCAGTSVTMAQRNQYKRNLTSLSQDILAHIQNRKYNGYATIIDVIPILRSASYMENYTTTKDILAIPAHYTVCL